MTFCTGLAIKDLCNLLQDVLPKRFKRLFELGAE
jgi:hypothetical protein